jgi:hypothetical protein
MQNQQPLMGLLDFVAIDPSEVRTVHQISKKHSSCFGNVSLQWFEKHKRRSLDNVQRRPQLQIQ